MIPPTLTTERLELRPFRNEDLDTWAAIVGDPETARYIGGVQTRIDAWLRMAAYHGHWVLRGFGQWAVVLRESDRFLGRAGLWNPEGWPELEVGWTIDRSQWGNGYATEAGRAAIEWGRSELGLTRIASVIHPDNARSIAVAERLGMSFDRFAPLGDERMAIYAMAL